MGALRLILGDQLSRSIASLRDYEDGDVVMLAEVGDEATYVRHHKKKIAFLFSAMRHFADELRENGYAVRYMPVDDSHNTHSLKSEAKRALNAETGVDRVVVVEAGEHRLRQDMETWAEDLGVEVDIRRDDRFIATQDFFDDWAEGKKRLTMEFFYREMRRDTGILMDGDEPAGGQWNFDHDNRKRLPSNIDLPDRLWTDPDEITQDVIALVNRRFHNHFGDLEPFGYAVTAKQARKHLDWFVENALPQFGDYQDAMAKGEPFLFHGLISMYLNAGLLDPLTTCKVAEKAWKDGHAPINAVEGFIRQILGWREFVRGVYFRFGPEYLERNALDASRPLPDFYWTGDTDMACLADCVETTRKHAYAHHIQRLMVTGNFALLAGVDPAEVNEWYLIVYADAYEWVEAPNTHGMALWADGGVMGTKPYAASGSYINKMSDCCKDCAYSVSKKNGEKACPFNYLYWNFLMENEDRLRGNQRLAMVYKTLERMSDEKKKAVKSDSAAFFERIGISGERRAAE